jgi:hypothetical protein
MARNMDKADNIGPNYRRTLKITMMRGAKSTTSIERF